MVMKMPAFDWVNVSQFVNPFLDMNVFLIVNVRWYVPNRVLPGVNGVAPIHVTVLVTVLMMMASPVRVCFTWPVRVTVQETIRFTRIAPEK
jgi:hypothetical protein